MITNFDSLIQFESKLLKINESSVFYSLFQICIENNGDLSDIYAGMLLIHIDPKCPLPCSEMLNIIANSKWNLSDRSLPFYLICQFGKWNVLEEINAFLSKSGLTKEQTVLAEGVRYWVKQPTSSLSGDLNYFEWREAIEKNA